MLSKPFKFPSLKTRERYENDPDPISEVCAKVDVKQLIFFLIIILIIFLITHDMKS